jgi:hypothetical protein
MFVFTKNNQPVVINVAGIIGLVVSETSTAAKRFIEESDEGPYDCIGTYVVSDFKKYIDASFCSNVFLVSVREKSLQLRTMTIKQILLVAQRQTCLRRSAKKPNISKPKPLKRGVQKTVQLKQDEEAMLRGLSDYDFTSLVPIVQTIEIKKPKFKSVRLKLPVDLDEAIRNATNTKGRIDSKYRGILIAAATRYREKYPLPNIFKKPNNKSYSQAERIRRRNEPTKLQRRCVVCRLTNDDFRLLSNLGYGRPEIVTKHQALCELTEIVNKMNSCGEFDGIKSRRRKSCRIEIPPVLVDAITTRQADSGEGFQTILIAAAKQLKQKSPENL